VEFVVDEYFRAVCSEEMETVPRASGAAKQEAFEFAGNPGFRWEPGYPEHLWRSSRLTARIGIEAVEDFEQIGGTEGKGRCQYIFLDEFLRIDADDFARN